MSLKYGGFCRLLIAFANSLDPDQDRQNVGPNLDAVRFFWTKAWKNKQKTTDNLSRRNIDNIKSKSQQKSPV